MQATPDNRNPSAAHYAARRGVTLDELFGHGVHGYVYSTSAGTAIKAHYNVESYRRELASYKRLAEAGVVEIHCRGVFYHVPQLLAYDDERLVIEMTIVTPPFVLDFGGAYLDWPPEFSADAMDVWRREKYEQFGEHWPAVEAILAILADEYGIYVTDVNPGNIMFADEKS